LRSRGGESLTGHSGILQPEPGPTRQSIRTDWRLGSTCTYPSAELP
jgi:hypothetical protein